jgi:hypothetical protein
MPRVRRWALSQCTRSVSSLVRQRCPNPPEAMRIAPHGGHEINLGGDTGGVVRVSHTPKMPTSRTLLW